MLELLARHVTNLDELKPRSDIDRLMRECVHALAGRT
jgi:hypothetical protein